MSDSRGERRRSQREHAGTNLLRDLSSVQKMWKIDLIGRDHIFRPAENLTFRVINNASRHRKLDLYDSGISDT